uniref:Phage protein n=1 Tax=Loa loa TaxID=7209 RepID=A0A1I7VWR6_LOALO
MSIRYPGQARTTAEALNNLQNSIDQALTEMLCNVGLNPTITYNIQGYKPDDVIIRTEISDKQVWRRNVGEYVCQG